MDGPEFVYVAYIATTPDKLWQALTSGAITRLYWYDRRIESEWSVDSPVRFYDGDSNVVTDEGKVLQTDPPRRLSYSFRPVLNDEVQEMGTSRVSFTMEPVDGMMKLTLVHDELRSEEEGAGFREGWSPILSSLKTFLETGKPMPRIKALEERGRPK